MLMRCKVVLFLPVFLGMFSAETVLAQRSLATSELFPMPEVIRPNVEFWKDVYAKHSERDVVIHDSWDMHIIYEVVNLDSLFKGAKVSSRIEWRKIDEIKKEYAAILNNLASRGRIDFASLSGKELRVAKLFGPNVTSKELRNAARRIRGQSGLRERFLLGLQRSGLYLDRMREVFREEGVPVELLMLPHVESSFNYNAYSKLGAAGLWQFTNSTGRMYMTVNYNVDQRLDPLIATRSAARLLKQNYNALESWPLAITAYNHGRNGMLRARRKFGTDIAKIVRYYNSRSFGFASRNFYSEFLAALHVATNYRQYFGDVAFHKPRKYIEFNVPDYVTVKSLLANFKLSVDEFAEFNPALRSPVLQSRRRIPKDFLIRVPDRSDIDMTAVYARISPKEKFDEQVIPDWHRVRRGENLSQIARRYGVSLSDLMAANGIRNPHRIYGGQNLQIPYGNQPTTARAVAVEPKPVKEETKLAEADIDTEEEPSILDVPAVAREDVAEQQPAEPDLPPVDYLENKPSDTRLRQADHSQTLGLVTQEALASKKETLQDIMAMALPNHYVEMTRNLDIRVVVAPKPVAMVETFREVDMPENGRVVVEPDETLGHFAEWLSVPTHRIRQVNRMSYGTPIRVGQRLLLTFEKVTPEEFHRRRVEYHQTIEEDFYRNFVVQGEQVYRVKSGDTLWLICNREFELPSWLLKKHNPETDFANLVVGQEILIPLVESRFENEALNNN